MTTLTPPKRVCSVRPPLWHRVGAPPVRCQGVVTPEGWMMARKILAAHEAPRGFSGYVGVAATPWLQGGALGIFGPTYFQRARLAAETGMRRARAMSASLSYWRAAFFRRSIIASSQVLTRTELVAGIEGNPRKAAAAARIPCALSSGVMAIIDATNSSLRKYARRSTILVVRLKRVLIETRWPWDVRCDMRLA